MRGIHRAIILASLILLFMPRTARGQVDLSGTYRKPPARTTPPIPSSATTPAYPSMTPNASAPTVGPPKNGIRNSTNAIPTPPTTPRARPAACASGPISTRSPTLCSPGTSKSSPTAARAPSTWTIAPRPSPYSAQTWNGFSTGKWEGDKLEVTTTNLKEGWIRRNGLARSNKATLTEYFIRHGDFLTIVSIVKDPVYLTEPLVRTEHWFLNPGYTLAPFLCTPRDVVDKPTVWVPASLPGTNDFLKEFPSNFGIPVEATRGGARNDVPRIHAEARHASGASATAGQARRAQSHDAKIPQHRARDSLRPAHAAMSATASRPPAPDRIQRPKNPPSQLLHVQGRVHMLVGAGANITVQLGDDAVVLVDYRPASNEPAGPRCHPHALPEAHRIHHQHQRRPDHTGGNHNLSQSGHFISGMNGETPGASIVAQIAVLDRMTAPAAPKRPKEPTRRRNSGPPTPTTTTDGRSSTTKPSSSSIRTPPTPTVTASSSSAAPTSSAPATFSLPIAIR